LIEARNLADNAVYTAEKALRDLGDKVPGDMKSKVEEQVASVRQAMGSDVVDDIRRATDELMGTVQQIGAAAYQQAGPEAGVPPEDGAGPGEGGPEGERDEDVVDGEFRNV
jgi:molecular chaperone DnaK